MKNKTFILGIGAQKAGTTWLHRHLTQIKGANFGLIKEHHYFDALYVPSCKNAYYTKRLQMAHDLLKLKDYSPRNHPHLWKTIDFFSDPSAYYDYFSAILINGATITGDITPSYCALPQACFKNINDEFLRRNINTKVIYLMRDPIERCWSALRMQKRNGEINIESEAIALIDFSKSQGAIDRTRYDNTLKIIDATFPKENIFIGFYETLFTESEINRLSIFLGIHEINQKPNFNQKVNATEKKTELPDEVKSEIATYYAEVYDYVADRYGVENMHKLWGGYKYL